MLICALIPLRSHIMPKWFTIQELEVMDDLTANNEVVLASFGGAPILPGQARPEDYGLERKYSERKRGVSRQRSASIHR